MEIEPLIRELGNDETSGTEALVEQSAKILVAFTGGFRTEDPEEFSRGLVNLGRKILHARPNLAPLFHMVTELFALAVEPVGLVKVRRAIRTSAVDFTRSFAERTAKVAARGAEVLGPAARVLTVGRSDTVERSLLAGVDRGALAGCVIGEGRPAFTGRHLAQSLDERGALNVWLLPDLSLFGALPEIDIVLVGTGAVRSEGAVTPAGTTAIVTAAKAADKPAYLLSGVMTLLPGRAVLPDPAIPGNPESVWKEPPPGVTVENRPFEVTPLSLFRGVVMENGENTSLEIEQRVRSMPVPPWVGTAPA
jgi:translation initiation factor 2B subunit (eIF-2B alpha/beta/delta family)